MKVLYWSQNENWGGLLSKRWEMSTFIPPSWKPLAKFLFEVLFFELVDEKFEYKMKAGIHGWWILFLSNLVRFSCIFIWFEITQSLFFLTRLSYVVAENIFQSFQNLDEKRDSERENERTQERPQERPQERTRERARERERERVKENASCSSTLLFWWRMTMHEDCYKIEREKKKNALGAGFGRKKKTKQT